MKRLKAVYLFGLWIGLVHASATHYSVKKGDNLYDISKKHHISVDKLCKINHIKKGSTLELGQKILLSSTSEIKSVSTQKTKAKLARKTKSKTTLARKVSSRLKAKVIESRSLAGYVVKKGDTLYSIAKRFDIKPVMLQNINHLSSSKLAVGQTLTVPQTVVSITPNDFRSNKKRSTQHYQSIAMNNTQEEVSEDGVFDWNGVFSSQDDSTQEHSSRSAKHNHATKIITATTNSPSYDTTSSVNPFSRTVINLAKQELGKKYVWGATGKRGTFDCSGFTQYVYNQTGVAIPRTSITQAEFGQSISRSELQKGDLIFFDTSRNRRGYVNHVGIYIGNNMFIHASSIKKKVVITSLNETFYSQRFVKARRPS